MEQKRKEEPNKDIILIQKIWNIRYGGQTGNVEEIMKELPINTQIIYDDDTKVISFSIDGEHYKLFKK